MKDKFNKEEEILFKMNLEGNEIIYKSLKVDDVSDGLIIKTELKDNNILQLNVKTRTIGSLKNILDDYFTNYQLVLNVLKLTNDRKE